MIYVVAIGLFSCRKHLYTDSFTIELFTDLFTLELKMMSAIMRGLT